MSSSKRGKKRVAERRVAGKLEEDSQRSKKRLEEILSNITDSLFVLDRNWNFVYINESESLTQVAKALGLEKAQDLVGKNYWEALPAYVGTSGEENFRAAMEKREIRRFENRGKYTSVWDETVVYPSSEGIIILAKDITERRKAVDEIVQAKQRLDAHMNNSPLAVVEFDPQFRVIRWSEEAQRIFGWKAEEIRGKSMMELHWIYDDDVPAVQRVGEDMVNGKHTRTVSHNRDFRKDGSVIDCEWYNSAIYDSDGKLVSILCQVHDVTERKRLERELQRYTQGLERLVEENTKQLKDSERLAAIGTTAAMVGHDLRNPLQTIDGAVYLLKEEASSLSEGAQKQSIREILDVVGEQAIYMNKIVSDLQSMVSPIKLKIKREDIQSIIDEALKSTVIPENVRVKTELEGASKIMADFTFMVRVLTNLITNAVQAMSSGGELTINALREVKSTLISVTDTGEGIPDEVKPKLFTPLFTTKAKGQGFGLAVCKRVVEAHGGEITFESQMGKGTTFTVKIPNG